MPFSATYATQEPTRDEVNHLPGPVLLEFGTAWCVYCQGLQADLKALLGQFPEVQHLKVEDGKGRPLGRSFHVKLWPALVFLRDGQVIEQLARPSSSQVMAGLEALNEKTAPS